jgi:hypothetical protein
MGLLLLLHTSSICLSCATLASSWLLASSVCPPLGPCSISGGYSASNKDINFSNISGGIVLGSCYAGPTWVALPCPAQREVQAMFDISLWWVMAVAL